METFYIRATIKTRKVTDRIERSVPALSWQSQLIATFEASILTTGMPAKQIHSIRVLAALTSWHLSLCRKLYNILCILQTNLSFFWH